jgi:hypothetical protein
MAPAMIRTPSRGATRSALCGLLALALAGCGATAGKGPGAPATPGSARKVDAHQTALRGHQGAVLVSRFSPNGRLILTASEDGTARLWMVATSKNLATLKGHRRAVTCAAWSADGNTIATGSDDRTVRLWHVSGVPLQVLRGHKKGVTSVTFSPDGKRVLSTSMDRTARLWRRHDGAPLAVLRGHGDYVQSAVFSPDGRTIVTGSMDGTARVWRLDRGKVPAGYRPKRGARRESGPVNRPFEGATGVAECDDFLVKYAHCLHTSSHFTPAMRQQVERSLHQLAHSWRQTTTTATGRKALARSCTQALASVKKAMVAFGCKF